MVTSTPASALESRGITVTLRDVSKTYQRGQETVVALDHCSITFAPGQMTLVLGPSGGGKSTLLHILGGMDRPTAGKMIADGVDVSALKANPLAQWRRRTIGFVFQSFYLLPGLSAEDNVALPLLLDGQSRHVRRERARHLLEGVGLADRRKHTASQLSGGQIQRVAIARALAHEAPMILADEPTGNLDSEVGQDIMRQLQALAHDEGRTVVVVSHNLDYAPLADRVVRLRDGRVEEDTQPVVDNQKVEATVPRVPRSGPRWTALVGQSLAALRRRLGRGILTGAGIAIGVASMVLLVSIGAGLQAKVMGALTGTTSLTMITVSPSAQSAGIHFSAVPTTGAIHPISNKTLSAFDRFPGVRATYGTGEFLLHGTNGPRATTVVAGNLPPTSVSGVPRPRLLVGHDPRNAHGIVIPQTLVKSLLGLQGPKATKEALGRRIHVTLTGVISGTGIAAPATHGAGQTFTVSGVSKPNLGAMAYVPAAVAQRWQQQLAGKGHPIHYQTAIVVTKSLGDVAGVATHLRQQGYGVTTTESIIHQIQHEFSLVETGLGVVGGIALAVAGLMIAVVMSMAVLERRREIGVWRAVGARRRDVFVLFLVEATIIGLLGGAFGDLAGWLLGQLGGVLLHQPGLFLVRPWLVGLGLLFGGGVAALAGAVPANHAAKVRPVEALRND